MQIRRPSSGVSIAFGNVCNMATSLLSKKPFPVPARKIQAYIQQRLATQALCWQSGRQAGTTSFFYCLPLVIPSVTLRFSLQEILTKDEYKKRSHAPSSWSLFPVSACQPKYCHIQKHWEEAPANQFKDWRLCLHSEHKGRTSSFKAQCDILLHRTTTNTLSIAIPAVIHAIQWSEINHQQHLTQLSILQESQAARQGYISHVWIRICGLFHNMGGMAVVYRGMFM